MENHLIVNPGELPDFAPGQPNSASVSGHVSTLAAAKANLASRLAEYASKCGGGSPPPVAVRPPVLLAPGHRYFKPIPIVIGVGIVAFCLAALEVCLPAALAGATF